MPSDSFDSRSSLVERGPPPWRTRPAIVPIANAILAEVCKQTARSQAERPEVMRPVPLRTYLFVLAFDVVVVVDRSAWRIDRLTPAERGATTHGSSTDGASLNATLALLVIWLFTANSAPTRPGAATPGRRHTHAPDDWRSLDLRRA